MEDRNNIFGPNDILVLKTLTKVICKQLNNNIMILAPNFELEDEAYKYFRELMRLLDKQNLTKGLKKDGK